MQYELDIQIACPSKGSTRSFAGSSMTIDMHHKEIKVVDQIVRARFCEKYPNARVIPGTKYCVFAVLVWPHRASDYKLTKDGNVVVTKKYESYKGTTPDADKCVRTLLDSLTNLIYENDARVVFQGSTKVYGKCPCVLIFCEEVRKYGQHESIEGFVRQVENWIRMFETIEHSIIDGKRTADRGLV